MKEKIEQVNLSIDEKRMRLKEKAERYFAVITIPSNAAPKQDQPYSSKKGTPPISYLLYGIAGASAICAVTTGAKLLCLGLAAASAFGGYRLSTPPKKSGNASASNCEHVNINAIKNEVTAKVLEAVKKVTNEWEGFMELKQKEVQAAIRSSSMDDSQKDAMLSKTFLYEVIDINISDFNSALNSASDAVAIKQHLNAYQTKLLAAIDAAANKQINNYNSLRPF